MSETLVWWLMMQVVGLTALPLCLTLFHRLPDRGYALSKAFALLGVGYVFWILNIMRVLPNTTGGIWLVLLLFALTSGLLLWRRQDEMLAFVRGRWWLIASTELLFFLAFVMAAYLRSYVPDITGTEKPMDFMFLNAVTQAKHFPPEDPWMANENVAYYYFGYLIVSIMTRVSGLETSFGFNLGLAMIVALAVIGAFGLVYNLTAPREERSGDASRPLWRPLIFGLAAAVLLAVMGNLEGILEWMAAHDVGSLGFWSWADIKDGELVPYDSPSWYPDGPSPGFFFWWRATRLLDHGSGIHEFPFFSFLLGDLHPHVMSIPFVLLAAGAALALLRSEGPLDVVYWLERPLWLIAVALMLGGLSFLNTWDMPTIALVVTLMALVRNRFVAERWSWGIALDTLGFVLPLFLLAFLAYTPFFFGGFDSQASGFTAESGDGSGLFHTMLIWGPFAVLVLPYAAWRLARSGQRLTVDAALWALMPAVTVLFLWIVWDVLAKLFGWLPAAIEPNKAAEAIGDRMSNRGMSWFTALLMGGSLSLLVLAFAREIEAAKQEQEERLGHVFALGLAAVAALLIMGTEFFFIQDFFNSRLNTIFKLYYQAWLLLSIAGGLALYELARGWRLPSLRGRRTLTIDLSLGGWSYGELAVLACTAGGAIAGAVLTRGLLGGFAGALGVGAAAFALSGTGLLAWRAGAPSGEGEGGRLSWRILWAGSASVVLLVAFAYPLIATFNQTNSFDKPRSLDGLAYLKRDKPDEYEAIQWLSERDGRAVVAEAVGRPYVTETSRISGATGLPTVLGWKGHEEQWRGGNELTGPREQDLVLLYTSPNQDDVRSVIQKYGVRYVVVGPEERSTYPKLAVTGMESLLEPAFQQGEVTIYQVRPGALAAATRGER